MIKQCARCGTSFEGNWRHKYCEPCRVIVKRERSLLFYHQHRDQHREQMRLYNRAWAKAHPERRRETQRKCYRKFRLSRLAKAKQYHADHREARLEYGRRYRAANRDLLRLKDQLRNPRRAIIRKLNLIDQGGHPKPFCHTCGKAFKPRYKGEKFCSDHCRHQSPLWRVWLRFQSRCGY